MSFFGKLYQEDWRPRTKTVYMYLRDRCNREDECWPAIKTIAKDTSLSTSTVKRAIADLVRYGAVEKEPRYRENGSYTSNRYRLKKL